MPQSYWKSVFFLAGALLLVSVISCVSAPVHAPGCLEKEMPLALARSPELRVLLSEGACELPVFLDGEFSFQDARGRLVYVGGYRAEIIKLRPSAEGITAGNVAYPGERLTLHPHEGARLLLDGASLPGALTVLREAKGKLAAVLHVEMERYLGGVLAGEVPGDWPPEALRAQAVVARTYALFQRRSRPDGNYHLRSTITDQVFQVKSPLPEALRRAVAATAGEVLVCRGCLVKAYFHSTCGGRTVSAAEVFGEEPTEPLSGTRCGYCGASPLASWTRRLKKGELEKRLGTLGERYGRIGRLRAIEALWRAGDPEGRVVLFRVWHDLGLAEIPAAEFRLAVGPGKNALPSVFITAWSDEGETIEVSGRGFGHGVGMCQFGASGQARAGRTYREILAHYYPGAEVVRVYPPSLPAPELAAAAGDGPQRQ